MQKFHWQDHEIPWRSLMPGVDLKTLTYEENKFAIHLLRLPAGFSEEPETHDMDEYCYMLQGKAESHVDHERKMIGPGDYFAIPANTPHSVRVLEDLILIAIISPPRPDLL
jgi:quercetin dioxygenase-like cupin family protein